MKSWLLRFLRIPEKPSPPEGSEDSLDTFGSSRRYLHYSALKWGIGQFFAFAGLMFSILLFGGLEAFDDVIPWHVLDRLIGRTIDIEVVGLPYMRWAEQLEALGLAIFAVQFVIGALLLKLRWETRWFMVTDTAVRIREGLFSLREQTLTIAKIQNLRIQQGPVERLFGIANLEVQTAGGGQAAVGEEGQEKAKTHVGRFVGIEDVEALRDRLRRSLRRTTETGLGEAVTSRVPSATNGSLRQPVQDMLAEARLLRQAAERAWGGDPAS